MNYSNQQIRKRRRQRKILCRKIANFMILIGLICVACFKLSANASSANSYTEEPESEVPEIIIEEPEEIEEVIQEESEPEILPPRIECRLDDATQQMILEKCEEYNVDFAFCMAMISHESSFRSDAISGTSDYGLMQINKINHEWLSETLGITDFLDPEQNVTAGLYMVSRLFEKFDDPTKVLMAYNLGETGARNKWNQGITSTAYAEEILQQTAIYQKELSERMGN